MTAQELRTKFLDFFKSKGHAVIPSASLVPANDPTVLFTTAGMHPLVPYLLGEEHPAGRRLVSCQKCIRTGDIDEVGDDVHLTFFEMLGNWSLGDYFKAEAIQWSWEFLTSPMYLGLKPERLAVSCFAGDADAPKDEESAKLWQQVGVTSERIAFLGKADNWWGPAGQTGPCGPDTEMFYWVDDGSEPLLPFQQHHKDPRWVEIWNDVFMQYNKTAEGQFVALKQKNVDTGMGLERTLAVLNGHRSVYETDLFTPIISSITEATKNGEIPTQKIRLIADHLKSATFIIADGVIPGKGERNYVPRRLIRDAMTAYYLYGDSGLDTSFYIKPVNATIDLYSRWSDYRYLLEHRDEILSVFEKEVGDYAKVFNLAKDVNDLIGLYNGFNPQKPWPNDGKALFDIRQSLGISWQQMAMIAEQGGYNLDEAKSEYEQNRIAHQDLSRTASAGTFKGGLADHTEDVIRLHTATHLMNAALRKVLGEHVWQKGSNITKERTRFDFTHPEKMTDEQKRQVEELVNGWIARDLVVKREVMPLEEARRLGAIGVFGEKYADTVSVYTVSDPATNEVVSREFCGGPHVERTGQIGNFKILKEEAVGTGIRRIKAAVG